jgi:hypothetical protein
MADAKQLWIIIHNNVIYAIFGVITKEIFNQSYSAPSLLCGGNCMALVLIDPVIDRRLFLRRSGQGGRLRSVCYRRLSIPMDNKING